MASWKESAHALQLKKDLRVIHITHLVLIVFLWDD